MAIWSLGGMPYAWQDKRKLKTRWPFQTLAQTTQLFSITLILITSFKSPRHLLLLNSVVILVPITQSHLKTATVLWQCTPQYLDPTMSVWQHLKNWKCTYYTIIHFFLCAVHVSWSWVAAIPPGCQCKLNGSMPLSKASLAVYTQFQKKNAIINGGYQYHQAKTERSHFGSNQKKTPMVSVC